MLSVLGSAAFAVELGTPYQPGVIVTWSEESPQTRIRLAPDRVFECEDRTQALVIEQNYNKINIKCEPWDYSTKRTKD